MSDQARFNAIFSRIQALYDRTFPASAGWRPNIQVSSKQATPGSQEFRAYQLENMMRAIDIHSHPNMRGFLEAGTHVKDIDDAARFYEGSTTANQTDTAERWLAQKTDDRAFFARKTAESERAFSTSIRDLDALTRSVNQRLKAAGYTIPPGGVPMSMLTAAEQSRFEGLYSNMGRQEANLGRDLRAQFPLATEVEIDNMVVARRQAAEAGVRGRGSAPARIVHPWDDKTIPDLRRDIEPDSHVMPIWQREAHLDRAQQFVVAQTGGYTEPRPDEDIVGSSTTPRAVERGTVARAVG